MKPEYERYKIGPLSEGPISTILPTDLEAACRTIAKTEHQVFDSLIIEGLARVVVDRNSDPKFSAIHSDLQAFIAAKLEWEIDSLETCIYDASERSALAEEEFDSLLSKQAALKADLKRIR